MRLSGHLWFVAAGALAVFLGVLVPLVSAADADVTLSATALAFGARAAGTTAEAQTIQIANTGGAPLTISTVRIEGTDAEDFAQSLACPVSPETLAVGASCSLYVSFTPHGAGARSATLTIGDDAASGPQTISLSGTGVLTPHASVAPTALTFGAVEVHDQTAAQTVTLTNTGIATLALSSVHLTGADASDFSRTTTCDLAAGLAAGASCTVDVVFAPHSAGDKTATLAFDDDAPSAPQSVALAGTATAVPAPSVGLDPETVSFGSTTVGSTSALHPVTITNTGGAALAIGGVAASPDFGETDNCPASLAPGASCTANVTLSPSAAGARAGTLTVTDDAADSPQRVTLSGRGLAEGTYFSDDFESASLSQWDALTSSDSTIAVDSTAANSGSASVRFTNKSDDQAARLYADLAGGGHAQSYTRFCFRIAPGLTQGIEIANGRAITDLYPLGIRRWLVNYNPATKGLEGYFFNDALQRLDLYAANGKVQPGEWHCAELFLDERTTGRAELWLDGVSVGSVTGDLSTPDPYSRIYLWNQSAAGSVSFDDVQVASSPSGPVGAALGALPSAQLRLSSSSLTFGSQTTLTTSDAQTVTLTNTGATGVTIAGITASVDFAQSNDCPTAPATLPAGVSCAVSVAFSPSVTAPRVGTLTVEDDGGGPHAVALSGTGVSPGTYLSADFESGSLNQWEALASSDSTIVPDPAVANSGAGSVRFTNNSANQSARLMADLAGGGHAQTYTRFCFRIAPGVTEGIEIANGRAITAEYPLGIRRFVIDYNPGTKGLEGYFFNETLQRLDMSAAAGRVLPGRWYCAELYLDEAVNGHARLWLDGVLVGSVDGDLGTPGPFSRFYLWNQAGAGTVWFDDVKVADAPIGPVGAGASDLPGPQVTLSPATVGFGSQTTQTSSGAQTVTLSNTGTSALTISGVEIRGPDAGQFSQTNNCPAIMAAGSSCTASITFMPSATGARTASLSVSDDASGAPHSVALSGTGVAPAAAAMSLSPTLLSFGDQLVGTQGAAEAVTLTNSGVLPMSISGITIAGANAGDFDRSTTCPGGSATLAAGASCTIAVTLTPSATGTRTATLSIAGNAVNSPGNVELVGNGTLPLGTLFMDGFESGLSQWHAIGNPATAGGPAHGGTSAAVLSQGAGGQGIYTDFAGQGYAQTRTTFAIEMGLPFLTVLAQGRDSNGAPRWEIDADPAIQGVDLYVWNAAGVRTDRYLPSVLGRDVWTSFEVDFDQGVSGRFSVLVDGTRSGDVTGDFSAPTSYCRLVFWNTDPTATLAVDDVSVTSP
jgi:Cep192 domain 4/Abnormal spindle-like microcephaly-assoc'd, ASPM-SPD-2-Hydin